MTKVVCHGGFATESNITGVAFAIEVVRPVDQLSRWAGVARVHLHCVGSVFTVGLPPARSA